MFEKIIGYSIKNKLIIALGVLALIGAGIYSLIRIPLDALPDITNNQVQVVTVSPTLAPQEVEQFITYPVEVAMSNLPRVVEIRSISRFGLSVVTIVFEEEVPILEARQLVNEQITVATEEIPEGMGSPELMPITTGLGEIYQYVLQVKPGYEQQYNAMKLRTIQDWIVKRQLAGTPGIIEISSYGGYLKQYEIAVDPLLLQNHKLSLSQVFEALSRNNQNSGGSYIEKTPSAYYIRTEGLTTNTADIENIVVHTNNGLPVLIKDVATVGFGNAQRFGAMTMDGKGEVVGGIALMFKGASSSEAIKNVHDKIELINKSLPEGVQVYSYLDRSVLVGKAINTVSKNLIEGGLIVIFVLVLLLGNLRAGLIVSSVIPLSLFFALIMMHLFGVSANLMSLGAIDFGIVVDGAVIIVEGVLHYLYTAHIGKKLTQQEMDQTIHRTSATIYKSAAFGVLIILVVFVPIMSLTGIEGKMFRPMAQTVSFAVLGAFILSLTYVPMMAALFLNKNIKAHHTFADKIMTRLNRFYLPVLQKAVKVPKLIILISSVFLFISIFIFSRMGGEFIPNLEEGDLAMQMSIQPGSSLTESIQTSTKAEKILKANFPEVKHVVSKIGTAEVPTDPMAIEDADIMIILKEKEEWKSADNREELAAKMKEKLNAIISTSFEFTQPIQLRFNELITGAKTDIAVKIFGEDVGVLKSSADKAALIIQKIEGAGDVKVEQTEGLQQVMITYNRQKIAEYGVNIDDLNFIIRSAYAGEKAGVVFEGEKRFDMVVRLNQENRQDLNLSSLYIPAASGINIPLTELATVKFVEGPMQISREEAKRKINIGINVRNRDIQSLVNEIEEKLDSQLKLPPGYYITYGGQFENLEAAKKRLQIVVPVSLLLIIVLLYLTFNSVKYALIIFSAVPFSAIGGILGLWMRDMPFSISAGVGFIALFGVAVLNGIVLISYFIQLKEEEDYSPQDIIIKGAMARLRPVIMTATVASLGFLPMALSNNNGAEVQKPLATVVIGGLITSTLLTLVVLPAIFYLFENRSLKKKAKILASFVLLLILPGLATAQQKNITLEEATQSALTNHPVLKNAALQVEFAQTQKKEVLNLAPTSISYQKGQINYQESDYSVEVNQNFGNILGYGRRNQVVQARVQLSEAELNLLKRQVQFEVKQQYYQLLYHYRKTQLLTDIQNLYQNVYERTQQQFKAGDINAAERIFVQTQLQQAKQQLTLAQNDLLASEAELRKAAFLPPNPIKPTEPFNRLQGQLPDSITVAATLTDPYQRQINLNQRERRLMRSGYLPELTAGYFTQSLEGTPGFNGWQAGVSIPIWVNPVRAREQQSKIQVQISQNRLEQEKQQLQTSVQALQAQLQYLQNQLTVPDEGYTQNLHQLQQLTQTQLRSGEIDYYQYAQMLSSAVQAEVSYLEILNRYNQTLIQLQYYLQPNS